MFDLYRSSALRRGIEFSLTREKFIEVITQACSYCGGEPPTDTKRNGIDRVDNAQGYTEGNVAPCCFACNQMKGIKTVREFLEQVSKIHFYREKKHAS